jgi:hypothetical protein
MEKCNFFQKWRLATLYSIILYSNALSLQLHRDIGNTSIVTLYNTRNTSIVMLQYRKSSIVYIVLYNTGCTSIVHLQYWNTTRACVVLLFVILQ